MYRQKVTGSLWSWINCPSSREHNIRRAHWRGRERALWGHSDLLERSCSRGSVGRTTWIMPRARASTPPPASWSVCNSLKQELDQGERRRRRQQLRHAAAPRRSNTGSHSEPGGGGGGHSLPLRSGKTKGPESNPKSRPRKPSRSDCLRFPVTRGTMTEQLERGDDSRDVSPPTPRTPGRLRAGRQQLVQGPASVSNPISVARDRRGTNHSRETHRVPHEPQQMKCGFRAMRAIVRSHVHFRTRQLKQEVPGRTSRDGKKTINTKSRFITLKMFLNLRFSQFYSLT